MKRIKEFLNIKFIVILILLINNIMFAVFYKEQLIGANILVSDKIALCFILFIIFYSYLAAFLRNREDKVIRNIIIMFLIIIWQYLLSMSDFNYLIRLSTSLQAIVTYFLMVSVFNVLIYGNIRFKKRLDIILLVYSVLVALSIFIDVKVFSLLYFIEFVAMYLYPLLVVILYRKYMISTLERTKRAIFIYIIALLIGLLINISFEKLFHSIYLSNIGWYLNVGIAIVVVHIRLINSLLKLKSKRLSKKIYELIKILTLFTVVLVCFLTIYFFNSFDDAFLFVNLVVFLIVNIISFFHCVVGTLNNSIYDVILNKEQVIAKLEYDESIKSDIANYLHDNILQSVIAIKNLVSINEPLKYKEDIMEEFSFLIDNIRTEIDDYQPYITNKLSLKDNYLQMISDLKKRYHSNKLIKFICSPYIMIFSPYDILVYRILRELINNAIKHSDGYLISAEIKVVYTSVVIEVVNSLSTEGECSDINYGRGLNFIKKTIEMLNGTFSLIKNDKFTVRIELPMEGEKCYENLINR